jgi:biotin operon repressor
MGKVVWNPGENLGDVEKKVITEAMGYYAFDRNRVSGVLGISRRTLDTRIAELKLESLEIDHNAKKNRVITEGLAKFNQKNMDQMEFEEEQRIKAKVEENAKSKNAQANRNR